MKYLIYVIIFITSNSFSQDLSGFWSGSLSQSGNVKFFYELKIKMYPNRTIKGTSYIKWQGEIINDASMTFIGSYISDTLFFTEGNVIKQSKNNPENNWCIKRGYLITKLCEKEIILKGIWRGIQGQEDCADGEIILIKTN